MRPDVRPDDRAGPSSLLDAMPFLEGLAAMAAVAGTVPRSRVVLRVTLAQERALPGGA